MSDRRQLSLRNAILIVIAATLLAWWPVCGLEFTNWDDNKMVSQNPALNPVTGRSFARIWSRPHEELYFPLTYSLWALTTNWARLPPPAPGEPIPDSALNPHVYHGLNLVLHAAAACMALLLLRELVENNVAATAGALLFALHPLQVEAVAWASGTKDVLFALLSMLALWQYVRYVKTMRDLPAGVPATLRWQMLGIATAAFILAMLAKPTAIVVPPMALALDVLLLRRRIAQSLRTLWPWFVLTIPCIIATKLVQTASHAIAVAPPIWLRPIVALDALAFYLWKLIVPANLAVDYGRTPAAVVAAGSIYWTWIIPAASLLLLLWIAKRGIYLPLAASVISVIALGPLLGLVPFSFQAYSTVADHYAYLPMIGPALLVSWLIARGQSRRRTLAVFAAIALVLAIQTFRQIHHWRTTQTLFAHVFEVNPTSFVANSNLSAAALVRGDLPTAISLSRKAIGLKPADVMPYHTLGDALRLQGNISAARAAYEQALQCEPNYAPAMTNLAAVLAVQGEFGQALPLFERSAELQPDDVMAQLNLGKAYLQSNRRADARRQFEKVLVLDPTNPQARDLLSGSP